MKLKDAWSLEKSYDQPRQHIQRRHWRPTPVFLPGKSHGWRSLVGCSPWGCTVGHDWSNLAAAAAADSILKSRDITLSTKVHLVKAMVFPVVTYGCESWTIKKAECRRIKLSLWTVVLEKTLESPLDSKEIQPVHPKGNQSWVFIGRSDVEAETPIFWPPDVKSWLIWKDPDAGKDWGQEKGMTEDEMIGWHHWLDGHEFW